MTDWEEVASKTIAQFKCAGIKSVFGEPYEHEGKKIIPVAKVSYGWGGGGGKAPEHNGDTPKDANEGSGMGAGISAKPYGFIVIDGEKVSYRPVFDLMHVLIGALGLMLVWRHLINGHGKRSC
jgi:uncharacterized spore protein YtfJ